MVTKKSLIERRSREATPILRRLLRQLGVMEVIRLIGEIVLESRYRQLQKEPDSLPELDLERAMALQVTSMLSVENMARLPRLPGLPPLPPLSKET